MYEDVESLTSKIGVKSKENLKVTEMEDKVVEPQGLQPNLSSLTKIQRQKGILEGEWN